MLTRLKLPAELDGREWRYASAVATNRRHRHAELELNLVTAGSGTYLLGSRRYQIRRGDMLWLFPAEEHVLFEHTPDFAMWIAVFRRRAIRYTAVDQVTRPLLQRHYQEEACRRLTQRDFTRVDDLMGELSALADQVSLLNAGLGYALLHAWCTFQRAGDVPMRALHPAVERAARLLREENNEQGNAMSLSALARRAGLSASRLSRLFKEQTGSNLVDFRNRQRLERFQDLYGDGSRRTLLDAALAAGFGSYPQFHRIFRRIMGSSPANYNESTRARPRVRT